MFKPFYLVGLGLFLISVSFSLRRERRNWRGLANCLQMGVSQQANVSSNDVLRFIHRRQYMIVSQSYAPTPHQILPTFNAPKRNTRSVGVADTLKTHCPFEYQPIDFVHTVPRYLSKAICNDCDIHCKPVMYTHKLLSRKCKNYWMWTQKTLEIAFVWVSDD
ncbi:hypothetical protein ACROYT_G002048 [Oculina patagonica]